MVLGEADGIFAASIIADIEASVVESVAGLVCGAVLVDEANNGAAAVLRIVGVTSEQAGRALTLCHVVIGHTHSAGATACRVTHSHTLPHVALSLAAVGLRALCIVLALVAGKRAAATAVVGVAGETRLTVTHAAVVAGVTRGVVGTVKVATHIHTF